MSAGRKKANGLVNALVRCPVDSPHFQRLYKKLEPVVPARDDTDTGNDNSNYGGSVDGGGGDGSDGGSGDADDRGSTSGREADDIDCDDDDPSFLKSDCDNNDYDPVDKDKDIDSDSGGTGFPSPASSLERCSCDDGASDRMDNGHARHEEFFPSEETVRFWAFRLMEMEIIAIGLGVRGLQVERKSFIPEFWNMTNMGILSISKIHFESTPEVQSRVLQAISSRA